MLRLDPQKEKIDQETVDHLFDFLSRRRSIEDLERKYKDHPFVEIVRIQKQKKRHLVRVDQGAKKQ